MSKKVVFGITLFVLILVVSFINITNNASNKVEINRVELEKNSGVGWVGYSKELKESVSENKKLLMQLSVSIESLMLEHQKINGEMDKLKKELKSQASADEVEVTQDKLAQDTDYVSLFNESFDAEPLDSEWASGAEAMFENLIDSMRESFDDIQVNEISCQSSMCKVSYITLSEENAEDSLNKITNSMSWDSKGYSELKVKSSGEVVVESFYMREGTDYPQVIKTTRN